MYIFASENRLTSPISIANMAKISSKNFYGNFRVKVYGQGLNTLAGLPLLLSLLDEDLLVRLLSRIIRKGTDREVCKLRRGLKITIYVK